MIPQIIAVIILLVLGYVFVAPQFQFTSGANSLNVSLPNIIPQLTNQTNMTGNVTGNILADAWNGMLNIPWADIKDMLWSGASGVARWLNDYVILPGINYAMRFATGNPNYSIPSWLGYIVLAIIFAILLITQYENIMHFMWHNFYIILLIIIVVFAVGLLLSYLHLV